MNLQGRKIAILVAEGVEDLEYYVPMMRLQEEGAQVLTAALDLKPIYGKNGLEITPDTRIDSLNADDLYALIVYQGAGPLMVGLLSGQVDLAFDGMGTSAVQIKAGKLGPLAVTSTARNPVLLNVPTMAEAGLPGYEVRTWYRLWAIKGTPPAIKDRMYKEVVIAMNTPELKKIWAEQGADPGGMPPDEFAKLIKSEIAKWAKVVKDAGAKVDY